MGYKGFQAVEAKPNKRDKTKVRSEEHEAEFSPTAAAFRSQPKSQTKTEAEKSKRLPGENPIDPKAVRADLKAARSLQKVYASQTHTTASNSNSSPKQQQQVNAGAWGSVVRPAAPTPSANTATTANKAAAVVHHHHAGGGSWGSKAAASVRGAGVLSEASYFVDLPSSGPDPVEDRRHAGGPRQAPKEDVLAQWTSAKKKSNNNNKASAAAPPAHVATTLVVGKKVAAKHVDAAADVADGSDVVLAAPDGSPLPISVAAVVLTADGKSKEIALSGAADKMPSKCEQYVGGMPKNANAVANLPIRAGLFMTVGGKTFSNASSIFEPWMAESYFKALTEIVVGDATTATVHPFYQHGTAATEKDGQRQLATVVMRLIRAKPEDNLYAPTTLIELEHTTDADASGLKGVHARRVRATFKSFAQGMLRAGEQLVLFRECLEDVIEAGPLKGAAGAEVTKRFAGKFHSTVATLKKALEAATTNA